MSLLRALRVLLAVTLLGVVPFALGHAARVDKSAKPAKAAKTKPQAKPAKRGAIARPVVPGPASAAPGRMPPRARVLAPASVQAVTPSSIKVGILTNEGGPSDRVLAVKDGLVAAGFLSADNITIIDINGNTPTLPQLQAFNAVLVWTDAEFYDPVATGNVLADYVDNGGGVVLATYAFSIYEGNRWWIGGRIMDPGYSPFLTSTNLHEVSGVLDMSTAQTSHPIFDGVSGANYWENGSYTDPPLNTDAILLAQDTAGNKVIATNSAGTVVGISIYPGFDVNVANPNVSRLFANALIFVGKPRLTITTPSFVNTTPITIMGVAPEPEIITVTVQVRDMSPVSALFDLDTRAFSLDGVALNEGPNSIIARGFDASANQVAMAEKVITLDTVNPMIEITSPEDGSTIIIVEQGEVNVTGTVADDHLASVKVNDQTAYVINGNFSISLNVTVGGPLPIVAVATDGAGNSAQDEVTVTIIVVSPDLYDAANFLYDINADPGYDGSIDDGGNKSPEIDSGDAYDDWGSFQVNGDTYYIPGDGGGGAAPVPHPKRLVPLNGLPPGVVTFEDNGREIAMPPVEMYGLHVSRKVFVPAAGPGFARYINQVHNPTGDPITVDLAFTGNLGSDEDTQLTGTSSGQTDDVVAGRDTWFTTDDYDLEEEDPALAHVFDGTGGRDQADEVFYEDGNDEPVIYWREVTVQPGQTLIYLFYEAQRNTTDEALGAAAYLAGIPEALFEGMSQEELDAVQNFPTSIPATLHFADAFARPGGPAVVEVRLESTVPVAGVEFKVRLLCDGNPTALAHFNGAINHFESQGFTLSSATNPDGVTTVLLFSTSGETIPAGEHTIMQLVYDIDPNTPNGKVFTVEITEDILSDPASHAIAHDLELGSIHIGLPGDVAGGAFGDGDGHLNILDIIKGVKLILGILPAPGPFSFAFFVADANADGVINILDIVWMINEILYGGQPARVIADGPVSPVTVSLGDVQALASGQLAIPVMLQADGTVAGVQATFMFDASQLTLGTPQLVGRAEGMTVQSQVTAGRLQVVIYSATGQAIPAGSGPTLLVPVTLSGGSEATPTLTLGSILLANRQAQAIPVTVGTGTVKVQPLPTAFALKPNRPNPFNPTTRIAYDVPQAAHIVVAVYNLLGQEVIRLVDGLQAPGRYEVTWDGRNAQGLSAASGVYLYRLTTSAGFSQTKRMALVK